MKNYNSFNNAQMAPKLDPADRPVSSLLTGSPKFTSSASAALLVGALEIAVGVILLFPGVLGIVYGNWGLLTYGCYGVLLIIFGFIGFFGIKNASQKLVTVFYFWKITSVFIVAGLTVAIILMVVYKVIHEINNLWFSLLVIAGLGLVFEFWSIGGILWIRPVYLEFKEAPLGVPEESVVEIPMTLKDTEAYPPPPQIGIAPVEDPIRTAVRIFNKNADQGLRYLIDRGIIDGSFKDIAKFMHTAEDISSSKLGDFLGEHKPFNIEVLHAFADYLDFSNLEFDTGLREFLLKFRLPGEAQKIDRIMECFAQRFHANNPGIFPDSDTAYLLAFSLIMLNTDAHNPAIKHKMSKKAFVANNTGIRGKDDIPVSYLEMLYDRIVQNGIKMESDGLFTRAAFKGWLEKRSTHNKWQRRWFVLKNNCLYYFNKPEEENPRVIIPLEGLLVRKIETGSESLSPLFEIVDPYQQAVKCVKFKASGPEEGQHLRFVFMANTREEADEWVNTLQNNNLGNPVLQLLKKRKNAVASKATRNPAPLPIMIDDVAISSASAGLVRTEAAVNYGFYHPASSSRLDDPGGGSSSATNSAITTILSHPEDLEHEDRRAEARRSFSATDTSSTNNNTNTSQQPSPYSGDKRLSVHEAIVSP